MLLVPLRIVPVSVPLSVPEPLALLRVITVLVVTFAGLLEASRDCTVTLKATPAVPVVGTTEYASLVGVVVARGFKEISVPLLFVELLNVQDLLPVEPWVASKKSATTTFGVLEA